MSNTLRHAPKGFTLVEMLVAISIAAILLAVAIPSFQGLIKRNGVENLQTRLSDGLTAARSEAASRNLITTICSSNTGDACNANTWSSGWIVFVDLNANGIRENVPGEEIIQSFQNNNRYRISFKNETDNGINSISFTSQGFVRNDIRAYAAICEPERKPEFTQGISVERSGRIMKAKAIALDSGNNTAPINKILTCE